MSRSSASNLFVVDPSAPGLFYYDGSAYYDAPLPVASLSGGSTHPLVASPPPLPVVVELPKPIPPPVPVLCHDPTHGLKTYLVGNAIAPGSTNRLLNLVPSDDGDFMWAHPSPTHVKVIRDALKKQLRDEIIAEYLEEQEALAQADKKNVKANRRLGTVSAASSSTSK